MSLDFLDGTVFFLDANILAYAAIEQPEFTPHCRELLRRIERGEVFARTAPFALGITNERALSISQARHNFTITLVELNPLTCRGV